MSGYLSDNEVDVVRAIGGVSFVRGDHSTGVAIAHRLKKKHGVGRVTFDIVKDTIDPYGFLYHRDFEEFLKKINNPALMIGHCRQATIGDITKSNAHPYEFENIIGSHNGTIQGLANKEKGTTDSYELYSLINEHGIEDVIKNRMPQDGAYALTWIDKRRNTLNMLRNSQRPLWITTTANGNTMFWASDPSILAVVNRHERIAMSDAKPLPEDVLVSWPIGQPKSSTMTELSVPRPVNLPAVVWPTDLRHQSCTKPSVPLYEKRPEVISGFPCLVDALQKKQEEEDKEDDSPFVYTQQHHQPSITTKNTTVDNPPGLLTDATGSGTGITTTRTRIPLENPMSEMSIDSAVFIFGSKLHSDLYPKLIQVYDKKNASTTYVKYLRYQHPDGTLMPPECLDKLLQAGCSASGVIATRETPIMWLNDNEYILATLYTSDDFYQEYGQWSESKARGRFVYATLKTVRIINETFRNTRSY